MAIEVKIPSVGESITTANVATWLVEDGSMVKSGDPLVSLETDKVSTELTAEANGRIKILIPADHEVEIGTVIAEIDDSVDATNSGGTGPAQSPPARETAPSPAAATTKASTPTAGAGTTISITVPPAGESITSASIASWTKPDGATVSKGEQLVTIETDKVSTELTAEADGTLKIIVPAGEEVPIGTLIGEISAQAGASATQSAPAATPAPAKESVTPSQPASPATPVFHLVDAPPDLREAPAAVSTEGRVTRHKMSMLRRKIATHLTNAQQTAAILTTFNEVDMLAVMSLRKSIQEQFISRHGVKLGFMSFFVKAAVQALMDVPQINASIDGTDVVQNHYYDIGVAIGTEKGLVVPVLRDCDKKSFAEIEQDIVDYAAKARSNSLQLADLQGGVFTISNGGTYGSLLSTPILNPPQSGILGMHKIMDRPVAVEGRVEIRPMMYIALSYDHRLVDGKDAVTFLIRIKECIETPARLLFGV